MLLRASLLLCWSWCCSSFSCRQTFTPHCTKLLYRVHEENFSSIESVCSLFTFISSSSLLFTVVVLWNCRWYFGCVKCESFLVKFAHDGAGWDRNWAGSENATMKPKKMLNNGCKVVKGRKFLTFFIWKLVCSFHSRWISFGADVRCNMRIRLHSSITSLSVLHGVFCFCEAFYWICRETQF